MFLAWYSPESLAASTPAGILNYTVMSLFIGTAGYVSTSSPSTTGRAGPSASARVSGRGSTSRPSGRSSWRS
jgi:hypothetical protein